MEAVQYEVVHTGKYCASFAVQKIPGSILHKSRSTKLYWEVLCEVLRTSFVVQSSTGKYFVQVLQYEVVLGSVLCKSIVVQTSTGKYSLAKSCTMK